jgi:hypothetical protein
MPPPPLTKLRYPVTVPEGVWTGPYTFRFNGDAEDHYTEAGAQTIHNGSLPKQVSPYYGRRTKLLHGQVLTPKWVTPPSPRFGSRKARGRLAVLPRATWEALATAYKRRQGGEAVRPLVVQRDGHTLHLLPRRALAAEYHLGGMFFQHWKVMNSRVRLGEKALRCEDHPNPYSRGASMIEWFVVEDVQSIRRGEEDDPRKPGCGRRKNGAPYLPSYKECKARLRDLLLEKGPLVRKDIIREARKVGISQPRLWTLARELGVIKAWGNEHSGEYWRLPSQAPKPRKNPHADIVRFLHTLLARGPVGTQEVHRRALKAGISTSRLYLGRKSAGVVLTRRDPPTWDWPGRPPPPDETPTPPPDSEEQKDPPTNSSENGGKRRRGRQPGFTPAAAAENRKRILDACRSGQHESISEIARVLGLDRSTVSKVLKSAGLTP